MPKVSLRPVPPAAAIAYFARKALKPSFAWQDVWQEEHARVFTVAKAMQLDVLGAIQKAVKRLIDDGATKEQVSKELIPELQRLGWWGRKKMFDEKFEVERSVQLGSPRRLQIIFDTNLRTAYAAQKWERIERLAPRLPYLVYIGMDDARTRPLHAYWQRVPIVLPVAHEWWNFYYPPNGWNCRCDVLQMNAADLARRGWTVTEPPPRVEFVNWVNRRTGALEKVPRGVDPGFGYNVGQAAKALKAPPAPTSAPTSAPATPITPPAPAALPITPPGAPAAPRVPAPESKIDLALGTQPLSVLAAQLRRADRDVADEALREVVRSEHFARFVAKPTAGLAWPVMRLAAEIAAAIGAGDPIGVLSPDTMAKQLREHPEMTLDEYRQLPELGARPTVVIQDGERSVVMVRRGDRSLVAVVRRTHSGAATFVESVRRMSARDAERLFRRGKLIFGSWA